MEFPARSFPFIPVQKAQVYQVGSAFLPGCKLTNSSFSKIPPVYHPAIKVLFVYYAKVKVLGKSPVEDDFELLRKANFGSHECLNYCQCQLT